MSLHIVIVKAMNVRRDSMKRFALIVLFLFTVISLFLSSNVYAVESNSNVTWDADERNAGFLNSENMYCGGDSSNNALVKNFPSIIPTITSGIYNAILVIVPLILVIMGSIDLFRASLSQNEDEIRKGKINFMKRLIVGIITFLIVLLTKFFVSAMSKDQARIISCIDCFINGKNSCSYMEKKGSVSAEEVSNSNSNSKSNITSNTSNSSNSNSKSGSGGKF